MTSFCDSRNVPPTMTDWKLDWPPTELEWWSALLGAVGPLADVDEAPWRTGMLVCSAMIVTGKLDIPAMATR